VIVTPGEVDQTLRMIGGRWAVEFLAELNIDLQVRGLQWQTQWDKAKSGNEAERQDILVFYWWPDYPDPVSWLLILLRTGKDPF
jgi:ABC-type transport system substrate-binding protein